MKVTDIQSVKIQILRGLAIVAVVLIHNTPDGLMQVYCRPFLNFSVGLFLFLSGMLSCVNDWHPKKRIKKVVIPYIIWTAIYVILYNHETIKVIPIAFVQNIIMGQAAAVMYYVFIYCEFTLLIPLIDKLARSKYKYFGLLITPIEIMFMRLLPIVMNWEVNECLMIIRSISCLGWFGFFYLGYLIGNNIVKFRFKRVFLIYMWLLSVVLQMFEGYWYWSMGEINCGTQLKLSAVLTTSLFTLISYQFIILDKKYDLKVLRVLGDNSFGIYFSHIAVMSVLGCIPFYSDNIFYPLNAVMTIVVTLLCVLAGKKILGKYGKYLGL